jgi:hypothetical protein
MPNYYAIRLTIDNVAVPNSQREALILTMLLENKL